VCQPDNTTCEQCNTFAFLLNGTCVTSCPLPLFGVKAACIAILPAQPHGSVAPGATAYYEITLSLPYSTDSPFEQLPSALHDQIAYALSTSSDRLAVSVVAATDNYNVTVYFFGDPHAEPASARSQAAYSLLLTFISQVVDPNSILHANRHDASLFTFDSIFASSYGVNSSVLCPGGNEFAVAANDCPISSGSSRLAIGFVVLIAFILAIVALVLLLSFVVHFQQETLRQRRANCELQNVRLIQYKPDLARQVQDRMLREGQVLYD